MSVNREDSEQAISLFGHEAYGEIKINEELFKEFDKKVSEILFARQEAGVLHNSFEWGTVLYECMKRGDKDSILPLLKKRGEWKFGVLAKEELRSAKNAAICMISFAIQSAISEKLFDEETGFLLSDASIQLLEQADTKEGVTARLYVSLCRFTDEIQKHQEKNYHYLIKRTKEYICKHFHEELTVNQIAKTLGVNPDYISRIFKKAEGISLKHYIMRERIASAKNMLKYSDYSISEIGQYLGFSTQSHFTEVFKRFCGMTPQVFRNQYSDLYKDEM